MRRLLLTITVAAAGFALVGCQRPTSIVRDAIRAARRGDHAAYAACFTARSRPLLEAYWDVTSAVAPKLARLGAGEVHIRGVKALQPMGHVRRAEVDVAEGGKTMPIVLRDHAGAWRIDLIDTERALTGLGASF